MLRQLTASCSDCGITSDIIDMQLFACFSELEPHVTYRAGLEGTSETDSSSLISLIEKWVSNEPKISVSGLLMNVDAKCSVEISSFNEGECSMNNAQVTVDSTHEPSADSAGNSNSLEAIIGGTVAAILMIAISITIVLALIQKYRRGHFKRTKLVVHQTK